MGGYEDRPDTVRPSPAILSVVIAVFPVMEGIVELVSVSLRYPKGNLAQRRSIALGGYSGVS
jgi:hypothetical protein